MTNPLASDNTNSIALNVTLSAFSLFINSLLTMDSTVTTPNFTMNGATLATSAPHSSSAWAAGTKNNPIYLMGNPFKTVQLNTLATAMQTVLPSTLPYNSYYAGVVRPNINVVFSQLNTGTTYYLFQSCDFAFFASSKTSVNPEKNFAYSNYIRGEKSWTTDPEFGTFVVDWWPVANSITTMTTATVGKDSGTVYASETAANFRISLTFPSTIALPVQNSSAFYLNLSNLSTNSVCGIQYSTSVNTGFAEPCSYVSAGTGFQCNINGPNPLTTTESGPIIICCYGANTSTDIAFPLGTSGAGSLLINFLNNFPTTLTQTVSANFTYNFVGLTTATGWTGIQTGAPAITLAAYKPSITMTHSIAQEGAYSKVTLSVGLGREAIRNSNIVISGGDISGWLVGGQATSWTPRCTATFNNTADPTVDRFIEACTLVLTTTGTITVRLGNRVVKCGQALPKSIFINIWPVTAIKDTTIATYTVTMNFPITSGTNILNTPFTTTILNSPSLPATPTLVPVTPNRNINNLCNVPTITPLVVNELGDFTFNFDFTQIPTTTANSRVPNEVFIFFPFPTFLVNTSNNASPVACYFGSTAPTQVSCSTLEDNWLRVTIPSTATLAINQVILVTGVPVPLTAGSLIFNCSANFIDSTNNNLRTVFVTGYGTFTSTNGISDPTTNGIFRLRSVSPGSGSLEPRTTSSLQFIGTFENTPLAGQTVPTTIANTPVIIVTLPFPGYNLNWYKVNTVTATLNEFNLAAGASSPTSSSINTGTVQAYSNKIYIPLTDVSRTIAATFQYWSISLSGVPTPNDASLVDTGKFKVTISNTNFSSLYRDYYNLSTVSVKALTANYDNVTGYNTNNLIGFTRGLTYSYAATKYIVDISGCSGTSTSAPTINYIYLRPGRASTCNFVIRSVATNSRLPQAPVTISLTDTIIKLGSSNVTLNPLTGKASFMIGVPCLTYPGSYFTTFTISDTTNYYSLPPIQVFVDVIGTASTVSPPTTIANVALGGTLPVTFTMTDYPVDQLVYTFYGDTVANTPTQDSSAAVVTALGQTTTNSVFTIAPFSANSFSGFFQIGNVTAQGRQNFIVNTSNVCFTTPFNVAFQVSLTQQSMTSVSISTAFSAYTNGTASTTVPKNSIQFTFTPPTAPMYINCMLICSTMRFIDTQIQTGTGFTANPLYQYFTQYVGVTTTPVTVQFNGLVRGLAYQLRCIGSSTQTLSSSRTYTPGFTWTSWNSTTTPVTSVPIQTATPLTPTCASFTFQNNDADPVTKQNLINYCQQYFTTTQNPVATSTNVNPACIVCTNNLANMFAPGNALSNNTMCILNDAPKSSRLRFLSGSNTNSFSRYLQNTTTNTTANTTANTTTPVVPPTPMFTFNVCPIQDLLCSNDVIIASTTYATLVSNFAATLRTTALFNSTLSRTVNLANSSVISDTSVPALNFSNNFSFDNVTMINFNLTAYNPNQVMCWWLLSTSSSAPNTTQMTACTPINSNCGQNQITPTGNLINNTATSKLLPSTTYFFWAYCSNNIPQSTQFTNVTQITNFTTPVASTNTTTNTTTTNTTTNTTTTNTTTNTNKTTNGSFISYGIALIISLFLIL